MLACALGVFLRWLRALEPAPFADSYHHWLVSARLVEVGGLGELFTKADGAWPPVYSLFGSLLLWLFGTGSIAPLNWGSILCSVLTTYLVARLAEPTNEETPEQRQALQYAPVVAAFLYALCPLDILTSSAPAMEPLAVLLLVLHWWLLDVRAESRGWQLIAGLCLALSCLTRYEAWGFLAFSVFSWRSLGLKRVLLRYGPAMLFCGLWLILASLGALAEKLSPEAARHTGAEYTLGALFGRFAVILQTLLLATSVLLPAGLAGLRSTSRLSGAARLFAGFLLVALLGGVVSGAIAGSHRYLALGLPVYAVSAARFWLSPTRRGIWLAALLPAVSFLIALFGYVGVTRLQLELGSFWFYLQPMPLLCLLGAVLCAVFLRWLRGNAKLAVVLLSISLAVSYLPLLSSSEIGRFVTPFRLAGEFLREEKAGVVLVDNPVVAYFSQRPPQDLIMANRARSLEGFFEKGLLQKMEAQEASAEEVKAALQQKGVTHIITEEVPYLFTRKSLLPSLSSEDILPVYWTRAIIFREVAVFRLTQAP